MNLPNPENLDFAIRASVGSKTMYRSNGASADSAWVTISPMNDDQ
jgi:hypothetical protein